MHKFVIYNQSGKLFKGPGTEWSNDSVSDIKDAKLYNSAGEALAERATLNQHWQCSAVIVPVKGETTFVPTEMDGAAY